MTIAARFHVEPPWGGETKVCSGDLGYMTMMAGTPIHMYMVKNFQTSFQE